IVPIAEYNPFECVKTNVFGAMNLIDACINQGVRRVVALSTDKASSPVNLYGATKLTSDKLFIAGNSYAGGQDTRFGVVRYGNVMGSRGSVIPFFMECAQSGILPITDLKMTRFMISLEDGVNLVWLAFDDMVGGEVYVKKIPSIKVTDIAQAVDATARLQVVGIRPGEKLHEQMIGFEDAPHTFDYEGYYKILPAIHNWSSDPLRIANGNRVPGDLSRKDRKDLNMIPYGMQDISDEDIAAVVAVLKSPFLTQGPVVPEFEAAMAAYVGTKHGVAVNSATSALHISCMALGLSAGDVLWTSPITFVASANCALYCGARVDFVDIDPLTFNISIDALQRKL
ncbi:MAG: aminotransferase class I/II-fold pyridoxal phosphate-dependent enzyme, partial [Betaproteobacteria bacterium]|nr:aminotransferase class I/II-fold pyridoxal phosphate-dependent enzyme [Betaproteobacteria bacterium]